MKRSKRKLKNFKKSIRHFIKDEDGFIEKEKIIKVGLGTISALAVASSLSAPKTAQAAHTSENTPAHIEQQPVPGTQCTKMVPIPASHNSHNSGK
jgi:hypothetical protein